MIKVTNIKQLTVPFLKDLAKECKIILDKKDRKADIIRKIENSELEQKKLQLLIEKFYNQYMASKGKRKKQKVSTESLEKRIGLLEEQVKFLMSKIGGVEIKLAKDVSPDLFGRTNELINIKNIIKTKIFPGESMTVDELVKIKELRNFSLNILERAVNDLIDDEVFDASEGYSKKKIGGNIGLLIRR